MTDDSGGTFHWWEREPVEREKWVLELATSHAEELSMHQRLEWLWTHGHEKDWFRITEHASEITSDALYDWYDKLEDHKLHEAIEAYKQARTGTGE